MKFGRRSLTSNPQDPGSSGVETPRPRAAAIGPTGAIVGGLLDCRFLTVFDDFLMVL